MTDRSGTLTPNQTAELLKAAAASIRAEVSALPAPVLAWHPAAGEWCIKEVLGHLIESEQRGFAGRIRRRWAALMQRAFGIDVLACRRCRSRMRLIATVDDPGAIQGILARLGLSRSGQSPGPAPPVPIATP